MTREEAWEELKETIIEMRDNDGTGTQQEICEFLANLMDILEKQMEEAYKVSKYDKDHIWYRGKQYISLRRFLEVKSETCDDAISRQAVIDELNQAYNLIDAEHRLKGLTPVTPRPKMGRWIRMSDLSEQEDDRYKCSHCGNVIHYENKMNLYTFNSWCGRCGSNNGRKIEVDI